MIQAIMITYKKISILLFLSFSFNLLNSCSVYRFKDISPLDPAIKTVKINYIDYKARLLIPQLSPQLTERLRQKVNNQTKLTSVPGNDAHLDISGYVSQCTVTTSGISDQRASSNRLIISVHIDVKNRIDDTKSFDAEVSRNFDFSAGLSLEQAQARLLNDIVQNLSDEIFNRIFSNW
jgi:carbon monoxide dehydrogenase subunit G